MSPALRPGRIVIASSLRSPRPGMVVIVRHLGIEKIKRLDKIEDEKVFVLGDNPSSSTDSRHFGWLAHADIVGVVLMPRSLRRG